jgi:mRNA-degrading endonuclease RelE of RelBE toxin-antitoxin system
VAEAAGYYIVYMDVKLSNRAEKLLDRLDEALKTQLLKAIKGLAKDPPEGDIKRLAGGLKGYRLRSGNYRIFFDKSENKVSVTKIATRGQAYKHRRK